MKNEKMLPEKVHVVADAGCHDFHYTQADIDSAKANQLTTGNFDEAHFARLPDPEVMSNNLNDPID